MTSRALFAPAGAGAERFDFGNQILCDPSAIAIPGDHVAAMLETDRRGWPSSPKRSPIPKLECEVIRRGADLQHQCVGARAMHGSGGDEKVIVLFRRPARGKSVGVEWFTSDLRDPMRRAYRRAWCRSASPERPSRLRRHLECNKFHPACRSGRNLLARIASSDAPES